MQQHNSTNKFSEIEVFAKDSETLTSTLSEAMGKFQLKKHHAKNFSFQLSNNDRRLSPTYDLLPSQGFNGFHTTTINSKGEPNQNILIVAEKVSLNKQRVTSIIEEITEIVQKNIKE